MESKLDSIILAFVFDLFFVSRIESVSKRIGTEVIFWDQSGGNSAPDLFSEQLEKLLRPRENRSLALILLDLSTPGFPWEQWLKTLSSEKSTRHIPVVAFGSHVNVDILKRARAAGAAEALAKSRFTSNMPALLEKYL